MPARALALAVLAAVTSASVATLPALQAGSPPVAVPAVPLAVRDGALAVEPERAPRVTRPARVVEGGDGVLRPVAGTSARSGSGPLRTYSVAVEGGLGVDPVAFARAVERTLADPRSWGADGRVAFQRVAGDGASVRVVLASPRLTDRMCAPLRTNGRFSCASGRTAVVNSRRWLTGAASYAGRLADYRDYVVNHEVGHVLGHAHAACPGRGRPAPVMVQQTKGTGGCVAQPWPFP